MGDGPVEREAYINDRCRRRRRVNCPNCVNSVANGARLACRTDVKRHLRDSDTRDLGDVPPAAKSPETTHVDVC